MLTDQQLKEFDLKHENTVEVVQKEEVKQAEKDQKTEEETKEFYASSDSDNDSDFQPFEIEEDDESDVKIITKPTHLYDLYTALQSDHFERYNLALEAAEELIRKNLPNLESMIPSLLPFLFRIENKFSKDDFEQLKANAIGACLFTKPEISAPIIFVRLGEREASLGHKIKLLNLIQTVVKELANVEEEDKDFSEKANTQEDYSKEFNDFFQMPTEDSKFEEAQEIISKRVEEKTKVKMSYHAKKKETRGRKNYLLSISDKFIYPLLYLPSSSSTSIVFLKGKSLKLINLQI